MSGIRAFGAYLPGQVVTNAELAPRLECTPEWIRAVSGIEERRYAAADESVTSMAVAAARQCLELAGVTVDQVGLFLVSSGSADRRFPGPASAIAQQLGATGTPAIDLPIASAGGLFGMALAAQLAESYGRILVIAAEKMSAVVSRKPLDRTVVPLFGDGAGACLIEKSPGPARIIDATLHSDGAFAEDLRLDFDATLAMNGRSVILQASRKIPAAIIELLDKHGQSARAVKVFLMHQANQNLMDRVARALAVEPEKFYSNIGRYGNTSSASMLIAAAEWWSSPGPHAGDLICFAAFGAGYHWGALLVQA
jgi:3-oxoacyl-[acyl-carrier-protein] synthase-3